MARKRYFTTEDALLELAMGSDIDMEPEDDFFGQMLTILLQKVAMKLLDESVYFCEKRSRKCLFTKYPSFQHGCLFFCYYENSNSTTQTQTSECRLLTCKSFIIINTQTHNASLSVTTLFVYKLPHLFTNFSRQPQASAIATLRYCSPKGVKGTLEGERQHGQQKKCWMDNIRVDVPAHARTAHKGLWQKRPEEDLY